MPSVKQKIDCAIKIYTPMPTKLWWKYYTGFIKNVYGQLLQKDFGGDKCPQIFADKSIIGALIYIKL